MQSHTTTNIMAIRGFSVAKASNYAIFWLVFRGLTTAGVELLLVMCICHHELCLSVSKCFHM